MSLYEHCAGWCDLDSSTFRKLTVYPQMKWSNSLDLSSVTVAAASFAGPIAVVHNKDEAGKQRKTFPITIHTGSGQLLAKIQWKSGDLLSACWTVSEDLLCLQNDGKVFVYSMFGGEKTGLQFSMGKEAQEMKISEWKTFESASGCGLAVLASSQRLFLVNNVYDPKVWRAPEIPRRTAEKPSCWTVFTDKATRVVVVLGAEIFLATQGQTAESIMPAVGTPVKRYRDVSASPDQTKLALLSENGFVQVLSSDFRHCFCECDSTVRFPPDKFLWCGNDAVALLHSTDSLILIGLEGGTLRFSFDEPTHLSPEPDGLRLYAQSSHEFLSRVPDSVRGVYQIASTAPGALLVEASEKYKKGSYQAYDFLRMIDNSLDEAIEQCLDAAGHERSVDSQTLLLQAASFGKAFADGAKSEKFVETCWKLRVINALREKHFGLPITFAELEQLTIPVLLDRLIARAQWPLAIAICRQLRLRPDVGVNRVLAHWASKIMDEEARKEGTERRDASELAAGICAKFREFPGVSFADVAAKAASVKLKELATLLLENEPQLVRQVKMLLQLGKHQKAISRAVESGDPDLIYFVILHLRKTVERSQLDLDLRKFPVAFALYRQFCRVEAPEHLKALYKQEDDFAGQALCFLRDARNASVFDVREKQDHLLQAERCFSAAKDDFLAQQLADQCKLLKQQAEMEEQYHQSLMDLSLRETMMWLIRNGQQTRAEAMRKDFKVPDKQFWWWKIEALAEGERWEELDGFSKSKKSPVGYIPFIEVCVKYDKKTEAQKYLARVPAEDKLRALIKLGDLEAAGKLSFEAGDDEGLSRVLSSCGPKNRGLSDQIQRWRQDLKAGKKERPRLPNLPNYL